MTDNVRTVNELSPLQMTMTFTDENGDPLTPSTAEWRLDDPTNGQVVDWTTIAGATATTVITIEAQYNKIFDSTVVREARQFSVRINDGLPSEAHEEFKYHVINLHQVTS